jgi:hypothetical protein
VRDYTSRFYMSPLEILLLFGRGLSASCVSPMGLAGEVRELLLPSAMSGVALLYFQSNASANSALSTEWSTNADLLPILVLVACLLCDTACSTALGIFTEGLIAPFWHGVRKCRQAPTANSLSGSSSIRQWLCGPPHNEKCARPCHSMRVSHNRAPPLATAFSTHY